MNVETIMALASPVYIILAMNKADRTVLVLGVHTDRTAAIENGKARAREYNADETTMEVFDVAGPTERTRASLLLWLADNGVVGVEAAETVNALADSLANELFK